MSNFTADDYLKEIDVWKKASEIHAKKAIEQYQRVTSNIEKFQFEKERNEIILDKIIDIIIVLDESSKVIVFNKAARETFQTKPSEMGTLTMDTLFDRHKISHIQNGSCNDDTNIITINEKHFRCTVSDMIIENKHHKVILMSDITHIIENEAKRTQLEYQVLTDFLTKLPNRESFNRKLKDLMQVDSNSDKFTFTLFFIDLDGFKNVNDTFGHNIGDALLIYVAKIMKECVRESDFVARLGGDEFVVILESAHDKQHVKNIANKLLTKAGEQITLEKTVVNISMSIGILMNPKTSYSISSLVSMADRAMYEVKSNGKNSYMFCNASMLQNFGEKVSILNKIDSALENKEFYLKYQPICDLNGKVVSSEVLSRWTHQGEEISPFKFISILEEKGMIGKFTYNIIDHVLEHLQNEKRIKSVSINLSISQFYDEHFIPYLQKKAKIYADTIQKINFEITESVFTNDPQRILKTLTRLKEFGFKIYIDDFGTGYSSFDYIRTYPIDVLKIDKVFVDNIITDEKQYKLLQGMIKLARSLDMQVIIEGVETEEQLEYIKKLNLEVSIQGYYFYKPLSEDEFRNVLDKQSQ